MTLSAGTIEQLRRAAAQLGETTVVIACDAGVLTFEFSNAGTTVRQLGYDTAPNKQELSALLGMPVTAL